jgi:titin
VVALQTIANTPTSDINLYWLEPGRTGGRPITDYIVEFRVNSFQWQTEDLNNETGDDLVADDYPTAATAAEDYVHMLDDRNPATEDDEPLEQGDRVRYRVYAKHDDATSRASSEFTLTIIDTTATDPATPDTDDRPMAPTEVTASTSSDTPGRIELSWEHTLRTGYRIDVSDDGMNWQGLESSTNLKVEPLTGTTRRYIHEGLTPGDDRYYRVFPSDGGLFGTPDISGEGMAGDAQAPDAVGSTFTASPVSATQINLAWSAPTDTGGRDIRRYLLEISGEAFAAAEISLPDDAVELLTDQTGIVWVSETSYQHKGLEPDMRYYYRLRSDNSNTANAPVITTVDGDGEVDTVGTITPVKDAAQQTAKTHALAAPAAPHSLSAHQGVKTSSGVRSEQGVYLTWLTASASGGPVDEYEIMRVVTDEDDLEVTVPAGADDANARTFYNDDDTQASLDNKERRYRVRAVNEAGESAWTDWVTYPLADDHTHLPTSTELTKPDEVMAESNAVGELTLTWEDGDNADSYLLIAVNTADTSSYETVTVSDGAARMGTVTGLTSGADYLGIVVALQGTGADQLVEYGVSGAEAVQ